MSVKCVFLQTLGTKLLKLVGGIRDNVNLDIQCVYYIVFNDESKLYPVSTFLEPHLFGC